jgi:hypothetical protein
VLKLALPLVSKGWHSIEEEVRNEKKDIPPLLPRKKKGPIMSITPHNAMPVRRS